MLTVLTTGVAGPRFTLEALAAVRDSAPSSAFSSVFRLPPERYPSPARRLQLLEPDLMVMGIRVFIMLSDVLDLLLACCTIGGSKGF